MASAEYKTTVSLDLNSFYEVVSDFDSYASFVTGVSESKITDQSAEQVKVEMVTEMLKTVRYSIVAKKEKADDQATLSWSLLSSDIFKKNEGKWTLKKLPNGELDITYSLDLEFKVSVPSFMLKGLIKKKPS